MSLIRTLWSQGVGRETILPYDIVLFNYSRGLVSFLKVWLDRCPGDFNDYPRYDNLTQLKTFAHKKFRDSSKEVVAVCDQMKKKFISFRISLSSDLDIGE